MTPKKIRTILLLSLLMLSTTQSHPQDRQLLKYGEIATPEKQRIYVTYLADDLLQGRSSASFGNLLAGQLIFRKFTEFEMIPFYNKTLFTLFREEKITGRNIAGVVRAKNYSESYIVVSAHYDHLGIMGDKIYNGADDNASGVSALLTLAEMFSTMRKERLNLRKNILFVAFDAKENDLAGSRNFLKNTNISRENIVCNINIDQIGSTISPPHKDTSYILIICPKNGKGSFIKEKINSAKFRYGIDMDIDYSFYNSPDFAEIFYRASDQFSFAEKGIPAILVTAGVNEHSYKPSDDPTIVSYQILSKRIRLLFYAICELAM